MTVSTMQLIEIINIEDDFLLDIFSSCTEQIKCDYLYINFTFFDFEHFEFDLEHDICLIGLRDFFNFDTSGKFSSSSIDILTQVFVNNPSKTFIVFSEYENINFEYPNVKHIAWSCMLDDKQKYQQLIPITNKILNKKHTVCLNRIMRVHKLALVSYLVGKEFDATTHISAFQMPEKCEHYKKILDTIPWDIDNNHANIIEYGYNKICTNLPNFVPNDPYVTDENGNIEQFNNADNFVNNLFKLYQSSLVEIISETLFETDLISITEKYLNSVYGCNFPIIIGPPGSIKYLRDLGFDVFDDVVEHDYDNITNHAQRLVQAIELNKQLILDRDLAYKLWNKNQQRFLNNVKFAKHQLYQIYEERILNEFSAHTKHIT